MPITTAGKNEMLDALSVTHAGAFNGTTPVGARVTITFEAADAGVRDQAAGVVRLPVTGGSTVNAVRYFDASTGGTELANATVAAEVYAADGWYELEGATLTATDPA